MLVVWDNITISITSKFFFVSFLEYRSLNSYFQTVWKNAFFQLTIQDTTWEILCKLLGMSSYPHAPVFFILSKAYITSVSVMSIPKRNFFFRLYSSILLFCENLIKGSEYQEQTKLFHTIERTGLRIIIFKWNEYLSNSNRRKKKIKQDWKYRAL